MATSQNGWSVIFKFDPDQLVTIDKIIGKVRAGDVAVIMEWIVNYIDANIEDVDAGRDDWGWNVRPIRGQVSGYSNHASATAIDVNATKHPRGRADTFSASDQAKIHEMLKMLGGVVRWGGDYPPQLSKPDDMHFEINANAASVKRVADLLREGNVVPVGKPEPVRPHPVDPVYTGLTKGETIAVQKYLAYLDFYPGDIDGIYGMRTKLAVAAYQRNQHYFPNLRVDGEWGPATQAHMEWTKTLQTVLNKWEAVQEDGYLDPDGDLGALTTARVRAVQQDNLRGAYRRAGGRVVDGEPGPVTCKMLGIPEHPSA